MTTPAIRRGLVIEDERLWSEILTRILASLGVQTTSVTTTDDAIDAMSSHEFDIVLLDLRLGDDDPYDVVSFVRSRPDIAARTIVVTSYGQLALHMCGGLPIVGKNEMRSLYPRLTAVLGEREVPA